MEREEERRKTKTVILLTCITRTGQFTEPILSIFCGEKKNDYKGVYE